MIENEHNNPLEVSVSLQEESELSEVRKSEQSASTTGTVC